MKVKCINNCCGGFSLLTIGETYEVLETETKTIFRTPEEDVKNVQIKVVDNSGIDNYYPEYCFLKS